MYVPGIFHGVRFSENERHADRRDCFSLNVFYWGVLYDCFSLGVFHHAKPHECFLLNVFCWGFLYECFSLGVFA